MRDSDNTLGRGTISYSSDSVMANRWARLAVSPDFTPGGFYRAYLDGILFHALSRADTNQRYVRVEVVE